MPLPSGGKYRFKKGSNLRLHFDKGGKVDEVKKVGKGKGKTKGKIQAEALRNGGE